MAIVTVSFTIDTTAAPNVVGHLVAAAQEWMAAQVPPVDFSGMTAQQKVKTYVVGVLKDVARQRQIAATSATNATTLATAVTAITTEANGGLA